MYNNVYTMTTLNKWIKRKTTITRVKGSRSSNAEPKGQEEEIARKEKEETA